MFWGKDPILSYCQELKSGKVMYAAIKRWKLLLVQEVYMLGSGNGDYWWWGGRKEVRGLT